MLLPGKLHHNPLLTFTPGPKGPGVFFFCSFIPADPSIAGYRLTTGYLAVRISDPVARPSGPLNSQLPATMPPGPARGRFRSASSLVVRGESGMLTHNMDAKVAEIPATAARIAQLG